VGYVVGGQVPRPDDDPDDVEEGRERRRMPATIRFVVEVGYLLSSFVLSIFPMWQPVAMEPPAARRAADDIVPGDNNGQQRQEGPRHLPQVQPPRDPAEYDDDDDEDDEDEYDEEEEVSDEE
jgi:hypothetical protein